MKFTWIKKNTNTNANTKKRGILRVLSVPIIYTKNKVKSVYKKSKQRTKKKLKMKYIMKKSWKESQ